MLMLGLLKRRQRAARVELKIAIFAKRKTELERGEKEKVYSREEEEDKKEEDDSQAEKEPAGP